MKYRAEIDGLRALAVIPVILFHAGFDWFSGGFVGVDIFFVISGYLITSIILSEMEKGVFSVLNFYERRARRILPALFFILICSLLCAFIYLTPSDLKYFGGSMVGVTAFISNIFFWSRSGYFDTSSELKPLLHTWSLAVEEQFYIIFPLIIILTWRLGRKFQFRILLVIFFISLGVAEWSTNYSNIQKVVSGSFFLLPTRAWELLLGVFCAYKIKYRRNKYSNNTNQIASWLGVLMILYSIFSFNKNTPFPSVFGLLPTVGTAMLILFANPNTFVNKILSLRPLVMLGLISYSAYLWHQPIFAFFRYTNLIEPSEFTRLGLCVISLVFAWLSWKIVEQPFRRKDKFTASFIFKFSSIGLILFFIIGLGLYKQKGIFSSFPKNSLTFNRIEYENEKKKFRKSNATIVDPTMPKSNKLRFAIVGDSMWEDAVNILSCIGDFEYSKYTLGGCPPNNEFEKYQQNKECQLINIERFSENYNSFDGVVIIGRYTPFESDFLYPFLNYLKNTNIENVLVFGNYLGFKNQTHFLDRIMLLAEGKNNVENYISDNSLIWEKEFKDEDLKGYVESLNYQYLSLYQSLCIDGNCPIFIDDVPFTYDVHHFTLNFSKHIAKNNAIQLINFTRNSR